MALTEKWVQDLLKYNRTLKPVAGGHGSSDSGAVGRAWIDGTLVVYDLEDTPSWLQTVLDGRDEDGNYERGEAAATHA